MYSLCIESPAVLNITINMSPSVVFLLVVCCLTPFSINSARSDDSNGSRSRVKLPTHLKPTHYRIRLMPFIWPGNFTTAGELDLFVDCLHSAHNVTLNAKEIDVLGDSVHIFLQEGENSVEREILLDPLEKIESNSKELIIKTSEELKAGSKYRIQIQFIALLNDYLRGFFRSSYVDSATGEKRWIAVSQFLPIDARRSFPCFDELEFKTTFEISLGRTISMISLSNMPLDRSEPIEGMPGWVWDHYQTTPPMSVSLAAFLVFDFEHLRKSDEAEKINAGDSVPFKVWSRPDVINHTEYAGAITPLIVQYYEEFFNTPYPLPKLDLVAVPEFIVTTMENWGLIVFRESMMLFDSKETTTRTKQRITMDIAHEVAHQWMGNLVSPYWWDDIWLSECFSNYMEYVGAEHVEPTWRLSEQFPFNEIQDIFFLDALESSHPVHKEVIDFVEGIYDSISYIKGASLFRMMNHSLGENTFRGGLTLYFKNYSNATADKDDLWQSLTIQAHLDGSLPSNMTVKEVMDSWILQAGYPVVTVDRNYESGLTSFSQERFLLYKEERTTNTENSSKWWVPITYTSQDNPDFTNTRPSFWLNPNEEQPYSMLQSPGEKWILVNIQETGYYRVNYDALTWKLLTDQLKSQAGASEQVIPPSARSQLLDDAFNLARSGMLPYSTALDLCLTLRNDTDYLPWASTFRALEFLDEMLTNSPIYDDFKELVLDLSRKLVESVGWENSNKENEHTKSLTRDYALRWSCHWGDETCIHEAKRLFFQWEKEYESNNGSNYWIAPDLREVVYCNGIRYGSTSEWEFAWQRYLDSDVGKERDVLLDSLGCTREMPLLEKYYGMMLNSSSGLSKPDGRIVLTSMTNNPLGSSLLFDSLRNNWNEIWKIKGSNLQQFTEMIVASTKYMTTPDQLAQLKQFWEDHQGHLGPITKDFKQAIDKVQANVKWMERGYEEVKAWIESQK